jgi:hypothetical protein
LLQLVFSHVDVNSCQSEARSSVGYYTISRDGCTLHARRGLHAA